MFCYLMSTSNNKIVIRQFSGIPWLYSFFNSSGSILFHVQYIISLAYLSKTNLDFDILHNIYNLRKLINTNNIYDLFPNKIINCKINRSF